MTDEQDGFEKTGSGIARDMLTAMDVAPHVIDWKPTPKLLEITREREVVFYDAEGAESLRVPFDVLVDRLAELVYGPGPVPPPAWDEPVRDEPRARKVGER